MRLQVFSDLHLEYIQDDQYISKGYWENIITIYEITDIVILCGDIGNPKSEIYWSLIKYCSDRAKHVLLLTGNHEYYGSSILEVEYLISLKLKSYPNVKFLQRDIFIIDDYVFVGATLWSFLPIEHSDAFLKISTDFSNIKNFDITAYNCRHTIDKLWMEGTIRDLIGSKYKIMVVTHFSPVFHLAENQKFKNTLSQFLFDTDMSYLFKYINTWIFGHTHFNFQNNILIHQSIKLITNQRGKPIYDNVVKNFNSAFFVDL